MESLGKKLDVVLSGNLETSCPQFVQLLQKLSEKLNANGRTKVNNTHLYWAFVIQMINFV